MEVYVLIDGQENEILGVFDDVQFLSEVYCNSLRENGEDDVQDFLGDVEKYDLFTAIQRRGQYIKTFIVNPYSI
jgi:hypothetical protein